MARIGRWALEAIRLLAMSGLGVTEFDSDLLAMNYKTAG
jgi:hypothetical protein